MGTHLRGLSHSYLMNTNMLGFEWLVASALEGLIAVLSRYFRMYGSVSTLQM